MNLDTTKTFCPSPFLYDGSYGDGNGDIQGRFCVYLTRDTSTVLCCLPCPLTRWIYSDQFLEKLRVANYMAILSLLCILFLFGTYFMGWRSNDNQRRWTIGLTTSLSLVTIAFLVPLNTLPDLCYDPITPNDLHTDVPCAITGAMLELGAMGAVVWILLGSIQLVGQFTAATHQTKLLDRLSLVFGIGLPIAFLSISLPSAGVSYRKGNICTPSDRAGISAWFIWLMIFAAVSWLIQVGAICTALVFAVRRRLAGPLQGSPSSATSTTAVVSSEQRKRVLWKTGHRILTSEWRNLLAAFIIINLTIYFSMVFLEDTTAAHGPVVTDQVMIRNSAWIECLINSNGNKTACLDLTSGLGLSESRTVGTFFLASLVGVLLLLPALEHAMLVPWHNLWHTFWEFLHARLASWRMHLGGGNAKVESI